MIIRAKTGEPLDLVIVSPRRIDRFILYYRSGSTTIQVGEVEAVQIAVDKWGPRQPLVLEMDGHYILDAVDSNGSRVSSIGIVAYSQTTQTLIPQDLITLIFFVASIAVFIVLYKLIFGEPVKQVYTPRLVI